MEKQEALLILNLESWPPTEVLEEIIEDEVFNLKDYFLRNPVVPILYKSRIRKLLKLQNIQETFLKLSSNSSTSVPISEPETNDLKGILRFIESNLAAVRQKISLSLNPSELANLIEQMINIQMKFEKLFKDHCHAHSIQPAAEDIKAADHLKTGIALNFIENQKKEELNHMLEKELKRILK